MKTAPSRGGGNRDAFSSEVTIDVACSAPARSPPGPSRPHVLHAAARRVRRLALPSSPPALPFPTRDAAHLMRRAFAAPYRCIIRAFA